MIASLRRGTELLFGICAVLTASASSVVPPDFPQLVNNSDYIVRAVVRAVKAEERVRSDGSKVIYSFVELDVTEVVAGRPPSPVVLRVLGGRIGDREMFITGAPQFVVGEDGIFFVQGNGRQAYPLVRMMHGLYRIERDGARAREYMVRSNGEPLRAVSEVSEPVHQESAPDSVRQRLAIPAMSPGEFIQKIRAAATKPELREH